jgi:hypothetical protein
VNGEQPENYRLRRVFVLPCYVPTTADTQATQPASP